MSRNQRIPINWHLLSQFFNEPYQQNVRRRNKNNNKQKESEEAAAKSCFFSTRCDAAAAVAAAAGLVGSARLGFCCSAGSLSWANETKNANETKMQNVNVLHCTVQRHNCVAVFVAAAAAAAPKAPRIVLALLAERCGNWNVSLCSQLNVKLSVEGPMELKYHWE